MIVRQVMEFPQLIDNFDHFNDAKDTLSWLQIVASPECTADAKRRRVARDRIKAIEAKYEVWKQEFWAGTGRK